MNISLQPQTLWGTKPSEYAVRFFFGGAISVLAMVLAKFYGPEIGGLFLAFPAIFPATATLVEKHERKKKTKAGINDTLRGRQAAGLDAAGAAMGCIGLAGFALLVWKLLPRNSTALTLLLATLLWLTLSVLCWTACYARRWWARNNKKANFRKTVA